MRVFWFLFAFRVLCGSSGFRRYSFESRTANECVGVAVSSLAALLLLLLLPLLSRFFFAASAANAAAAAAATSAVKLIQSRIRHKQQQCVRVLLLCLFAAD